MAQSSPDVAYDQGLLDLLEPLKTERRLEIFQRLTLQDPPTDELSVNKTVDVGRIDTLLQLGQFRRIQNRDSLRNPSGLTNMNAQLLWVKNGRVLRSGLVYAYGAVFADTVRGLPEDWMLYNGMRPGVYNGLGLYKFNPLSMTAVARFTAKIRKVDVPIFAFDSWDGTQNFGHFVHDTLMQLLPYMDAKARNPDLVPAFLRPFRYPSQIFLMKCLLGEDFEKAIYCDGMDVQAPTVFFTTRLFRPERRAINIPCADFLMAAINEKVVKPYGRPGPVMESFISREDAVIWNKAKDPRSFGNVAEFEDLCASRGMSRLVMSTLSPEETVATLGRSRLLIGVHGAGLLNAVFMPKGSRVIELVGHPQSWSSIYVALTAFGYRVDRLRAVPPTNEESLPGIDLESLDGLLAS